MNMNPRIKQLWIDALLSEDYEQCRGRLRFDDKFCCLGVLCNLHAIEHPEIAAAQPGSMYYMGMDNYLPEAVKTWAGIKTDFCVYKDGRSLVDDNDDAELPFTEIASIIQQYL